MTLQKWIKDRAIHGYPTFSIEDVRESGMSYPLIYETFIDKMEGKRE